MEMKRRAFLGSLGAGLLAARRADAQSAQTAAAGAPPVPNRKVKTTPLFKSPEGYPNGMAVVPDGVWIAEQVKAVMAQPVIVDLRNIYRSDEMRRAAFRYVPIGRAGVE